MTATLRGRRVGEGLRLRGGFLVLENRYQTATHNEEGIDLDASYHG